MSEYQPVTLANINGGAAVELFERELESVLKNCADPNTKPDAKRKITLTVVVQPDEKRELLAFAVEAKSTLAATRPSLGIGYLVRREGELAAVASDVRQADLFGTGAERDGKVVPMTERKVER